MDGALPKKFNASNTLFSSLNLTTMRQKRNFPKDQFSGFLKISFKKKMSPLNNNRTVVIKFFSLVLIIVLPHRIAVERFY